MASTGTWKGPSGYGGAFGYQEDSNGLHLLGHRYYDSTTGRFLTRDPIRDGQNWYSYCENDPVSRTDSTGLTWYYDQRTGYLWWDNPKTEAFDPKLVSKGFAGKQGNGRNNPDLEFASNVGPIPKGRYKIGKRRSKKSSGRKLDNLPLTPDSNNDMNGRDSFLIHPGNPAKDPSEGCICMTKDVMDKIERSGDTDLVVYDSGEVEGIFSEQRDKQHSAPTIINRPPNRDLSGIIRGGSRKSKNPWSQIGK